MPLKYRKKGILAKIESSYGSDSGPAGADAMEVSDVTITPMAAEAKEREIAKPELGSDPKFLTGLHVSAEFSVAIAGSGAAGTAPAYDALLRACAMEATTAEGTSVAYSPRSAGMESVTIHFVIDGIIHRMTGCRGNVTLEMEGNEIPTFQFTFTGLWNDPASQSMPTMDRSKFQTPLAVSKAHTPTFSLHGYDGVLSKLSLDGGNSVIHRDLVGSTGIEITDRKTSGSVTIEAPALDDKDFFALAKPNRAGEAQLGALSLTHGTTAGNIVSIAAPKVQVLNPSYSDSDGIAMLDMELVVTPATGDDELVITVK